MVTIFFRKTNKSCSRALFNLMRLSCKAAAVLGLACGVSTVQSVPSREMCRCRKTECLVSVSVGVSVYPLLIGWCPFAFVLFSVSKAIMTAHGGHLWVKSNGVSGEGCVFGMELQVASVHAVQETEPLMPQIAQRPDITSTPNELSLELPPSLRLDVSDSGSVAAPRVVSTADANHYDLVHALVVDDSPMNRKMLMLHLKGFGIVHVTQACNGLEAVQAVEERLTDVVEECCDKKLFDIIFMDCNMPVMGGNEATSKIRELGFLGPIVTVTGNGLPEDVREIMTCGSSQVLVKPVKADDVESVLEGKPIDLSCGSCRTLVSKLTRHLFVMTVRFLVFCGMGTQNKPAASTGAPPHIHSVAIEGRVSGVLDEA
jgi:CheY-like chemotaxis protein